MPTGTLGYRPAYSAWARCLQSTQRIMLRVLQESRGRGREARTPDLRIWNPLLYQLSYTPSSYFVSRCKVCFLHCLQYFFSSNA